VIVVAGWRKAIQPFCLRLHSDFRQSGAAVVRLSYGTRERVRFHAEDSRCGWKTKFGLFDF
jgi:hypothetical protein